MRLVTATALAAASSLAACAPSPAPKTGEAEPSARYTFWRPAPVLEAKEPAEVIKASSAADWRPVDPENLVIMELANGGQVAIELVSDFAPIHVANMKALARGGWWNPASVYRVQEN